MLHCCVLNSQFYERSKLDCLMKRLFASGPLLSITLFGVCSASQLHPGDLLVADPTGQTVYFVDPSNGNRSILSSSGSGAIGSGPGFQPVGIAVAPNGKVIVTDPFNDAVLQIDPLTGNRSYLSSQAHGVGTGNPILPRQVAVAADGTIYVTDSGTIPGYGHGQSVYRIDPSTGNRTIFSSAGLNVGTGPAWFPFDLAVRSNGDVIVSDPSSQALYLVDHLTGNRSVLSSSQASIATGNGPGFAPVGIAVGPNGSIVAGDPANDALLQIDLLTGNRSYLSSQPHGVGSGPPIQPRGIAIGPDGFIFSTDSGLIPDYGHGQSVYRIDPISGNRSIASSFDLNVGSGPPWTPFDVAVVVPEPSSLTLAGLGLLGLLAWGWRSKVREGLSGLVRV